jgi:hypothetical protein
VRSLLLGEEGFEKMACVSGQRLLRGMLSWIVTGACI